MILPPLIEVDSTVSGVQIINPLRCFFSLQRLAGAQVLRQLLPPAYVCLRGFAQVQVTGVFMGAFAGNLPVWGARVLLPAQRPFARFHCEGAGMLRH